jgi:hypothetical protein
MAARRFSALISGRDGVWRSKDKGVCTLGRSSAPPSSGYFVYLGHGRLLRHDVHHDLALHHHFLYNFFKLANVPSSECRHGGDRFIYCVDAGGWNDGRSMGPSEDDDHGSDRHLVGHLSHPVADVSRPKLASGVDCPSLVGDLGGLFPKSHECLDGSAISHDQPIPRRGLGVYLGCGHLWRHHHLGGHCFNPLFQQSLHARSVYHIRRYDRPHRRNHGQTEV